MDYAISRWITQIFGDSKFFADTMKIISFVGSKWIILAITATLLIIRKTRKLGIYLFVACGACFVINNMFIRELVARHRPFVHDPALLKIPELAGIELPDDYSFASGHAMSTMALATMIFMFDKRRGGWTFFYPFFVGISRVLLCVHFTTDVLGGWVIGATIAVCGYFVLNWIVRYAEKKYTKKKGDNAPAEKESTNVEKTIIFATANMHKIKEVSTMLSGYKVLSLKDIGFDDVIEENGETTEANAEIKVRAIENFCKRKSINYPILADDSGLFINALNGEPGVYSARYGGDHTNESNRKKVLDKLKGKRNRTAYFKCSLCYLDKNGIQFFEGRTEGVITKKEIGDRSFCYDCLFFSNDLNKTFGEATEAEKDSVSHRGRAVEELKKYLKEKGK